MSVDYYVSTDGSDSNSGLTLASSLLTITGAKDKICTYKSANGLPDGGINVFIREGIYELSSYIDLNTSAAGEPNKEVVFQPYNDEDVRIISGKIIAASSIIPITSAMSVWSKCDKDARDNIVKIDLYDLNLISTTMVVDYLSYQVTFTTDLGGPVTRNFAYGNYTVQSLATGLEARLNTDATINPGGVITFDVSYDTTTRKFTITADGGHTIAFTFATSNGAKLFGFTGDVLASSSISSHVSVVNTLNVFNSSGQPQFEVYYNQERLTMSRYPKKVENDAFNITAFDTIVSAVTTVGTTTFKPSVNIPTTWASASHAHIYGMFYYLWNDQHIIVSSIDCDNNLITLLSAPTYGFYTGRPYYIENLIEEVTTSGEYYFDPTMGVLYLYAPNNYTTGEIMITNLEHCLRFRTGCCHVRFEKLTFECAEGASNSVVRLDSGSFNNIINACTIKNSVHRGITIGGTNNVLKNSKVYNTGYEAIYLDGGTRTSLIKGNNKVFNCEVTNTNLWGSYYLPAVYITGCGNILQNCKIHDISHTGIRFYGNEHKIEYNELYNICKLTNDAGVIYGGRNYDYRGNIIRYNYIYNISSNFSDSTSISAIYLDDCICGVYVYGNIINNVTGRGIQHGGGRDVKMYNNLIMNCSKYALVTDSRGWVWQDDWNFIDLINDAGINYQSGIWSKKYPELALIPNDLDTHETSASYQTWLIPQGTIFTNNAGFNLTSGNIFDADSALTWFISTANNNFDISSSLITINSDNVITNIDFTDSVFTSISFTSIPYTKIGLVKRSSKLRNMLYRLRLSNL